jgi:predicted P-loop ATPase
MPHQNVKDAYSSDRAADLRVRRGNEGGGVSFQYRKVIGIDTGTEHLPGWEDMLIRNKQGEPRALLANAIKALKYAPEWDGVLGFNDFSLGVVAVKQTPWGGIKAGSPWSDNEDRLTTEWLQDNGIHVSTDIAGQAVQTVARERRFHPVRDYLDGLKWDGRGRLGSWAEKYLGVQTSDDIQLSQYVSAVGARFLIQAVARIYKPGAKADCCLILEGTQGLKKSTALKTLSEPWFTDEIADLGTKDSAMQTHGVWMIEIAELDSMNRSEVGAIKSFMSRTTDRFRPPYGKHLVEAPRQCVFAGSVNNSTYLRDETGGRRFWPLSCTAIDVDQLASDRDQLWAEAVGRFKAGEVWWLDSEELNRAASTEQAQRYEGDPWQERIREWALDPVSGRDKKAHNTGVSISEILTHCLNKGVSDWTQADKNRIARSLVALRFERRKVGSRESREWRYFPVAA